MSIRKTLPHARSWFRRHWPLVWRWRLGQVRHEARCTCEAERERMVVRHAAELREAEKEAAEMVGKLIRVEGGMDERSQQFRVCVDFDYTLVYRAFEWGNDNRAIAFMGRMVARKVEQEMRSLNCLRPKYHAPSAVDWRNDGPVHV